MADRMIVNEIDIFI